MQIVYKSERYEIELYNPGREKLVMTFDFWERGKVGLEHVSRKWEPVSG